MPERVPIPAAVASSGLLAILRGLPAGETVALAQRLERLGVAALEVTCDTPGHLDAIRGVRAACPGLAVGVGTVLEIDAAEAARAAGAQFLVSPHVDAELIGWAGARGLATFAGAMTPTEAVTAWRAGASAVKLFPAGSLGPGYLRELRAPLRQIPFVPTGGVSAANVAEHFAAGAVAVGVGGGVTDADDAAVRALVETAAGAVAARG
ncbi:bifunctional 4-hydroxy-2-oxoglutarate aldolase/2-dehydro-3-deoxy-phosphogluconate aldolase [Conexibacter woesei]|uniref:KDPG and KHG aldolase n=1 Tax=Conexibacter woesei (strain DSM 14684 / CCUG 47730 / CIP 108061 / JCM 11494 / NBRC 100937 / ID131577) TaxID=469383 RepID=D3F2I1_CONWI|nr:bifunctional 4-hydroxy-2-oxoglutarate aldolase/2-dehydro-3-deoxy-phosphogluconate aldolase [Conexibacter woesei]ADB52247.1 KDPG and KHG aldolase [Conexibacter woesei DSM 14684]